MIIVLVACPLTGRWPHGNTMFWHVIVLFTIYTPQRPHQWPGECFDMSPFCSYTQSQFCSQSSTVHHRFVHNLVMYMGHSCWNYHITIKKCTWYLTYFVFTNSIFFYMIMDRCIYLNQDHFVTKLNNGFWISGSTFYPQKLITVTMEKCNCWLKVYNKLKLIQSTTAKFT